MNTLIFQAIRAGVVVGVAFFAMVDSAFAAPTFAPTMVSEITTNSATLDGYVVNTNKYTIVWFEWSDAYSAQAPIAVARQSIYNEGSFKYSLTGLNPGATYSFRTAGMEGGVTTYSPVVSFKTLSSANTSQSGQVSGPLGIGPLTSSPTPTQVVNPAPAQVAPQTQTHAQAVVKEQVVSPVSKEGFTNTNAAAVIGVGNGVLPGTLIGWVLLIISILVAVLIAHMIYEASEKRKRAIEMKKKEEEAE